MTTPIDLAHLRQWLNRPALGADSIDLDQARLLAATLDQAPDSLQEGTPLPELWHWIYFREGMRPGALGPDGHPARGSFLPPVPLPNRMWAGGRLEFVAPVNIGDALRKRSTVQRIDHKAGRSGDLVFVTVQHELLRDGICLLREEQDLVYTGARTGKSSPPGPLPTRQATLTRTVSPTSTLLFRYSALTFNGHRIHYDQDYCRQVEGYPNLVVHGPLNATLLAGLAVELAARPLRCFAYRGVQPIFLGEDYRLNACRNGEGVAVWATRADGTLAMTGEAVPR